MLFVSLISYSVFVSINLYAFIKFTQKAETFTVETMAKNENHLYLRWIVLLLINLGILYIQPVFNTYFQLSTNQGLLDTLATIGGVLIFICTPLLYFYQRRYKNVINYYHSLGIVLIYVIEIVCMTMSTFYFIFV